MNRIIATILSFAIALLPATAHAQQTTLPSATPLPPPAPITTPATAAPAPADSSDASSFQLPDMGDFLPLHRGVAAPRDGLFVDQTVMLGIVQDFDRLQHLLGAMQQRDSETCDVRVAVEHAHVTAAEERLTLRDDLWTARQQELVTAVQAAQQQAQRASQRDFWEQPVLWLAIGALLATAVFIGVSVR